MLHSLPSFFSACIMFHSFVCLFSRLFAWFFIFPPTDLGAFGEVLSKLWDYRGQAFGASGRLAGHSAPSARLAALR